MRWGAVCNVVRFPNPLEKWHSCQSGNQTRLVGAKDWHDMRLVGEPDLAKVAPRFILKWRLNSISKWRLNSIVSFSQSNKCDLCRCTQAGAHYLHEAQFQTISLTKRRGASSNATGAFMLFLRMLWRWDVTWGITVKNGSRDVISVAPGSLQDALWGITWVLLPGQVGWSPVNGFGQTGASSSTSL